MAAKVLQTPLKAIKPCQLARFYAWKRWLKMDA